MYVSITFTYIYKCIYNYNYIHMFDHYLSFHLIAMSPRWSPSDSSAPRCKLLQHSKDPGLGWLHPPWMRMVSLVDDCCMVAHHG